MCIRDSGKEAYGEQNQSYQRGGMYNGAADDRVRSTSSGVFSGRSSDSDSPPPKTTEVRGCAHRIDRTISA